MPILDLVERERDRIRNKYHQLEKTQLPSSMNSDPFQMFSYYCSVVADKQDDKLTHLFQEIEVQKMHTVSKQHELTTIRKAHEILMKDTKIL